MNLSGCICNGPKLESVFKFFPFHFKYIFLLNSVYEHPSIRQVTLINRSSIHDDFQSIMIHFRFKIDNQVLGWSRPSKMKFQSLITQELVQGFCPAYFNIQTYFFIRDTDYLITNRVLWFWMRLMLQPSCIVQGRMIPYIFVVYSQSRFFWTSSF